MGLYIFTHVFSKFKEEHPPPSRWWCNFSNLIFLAFVSFNVLFYIHGRKSIILIKRIFREQPYQKNAQTSKTYLTYEFQGFHKRKNCSHIAKNPLPMLFEGNHYVSLSKNKLEMIRKRAFMTLKVSFTKYQTIIFILNGSDQLLVFSTNFISSCQMCR